MILVGHLVGYGYMKMLHEGKKKEKQNRKQGDGIAAKTNSAHGMAKHK